jgi:hypothetical protein
MLFKRLAPVGVWSATGMDGTRGVDGIGAVGHPPFPYLPSSHQSVWRVIWPGECFDQFGRTSTCREPHAEQRNLPFTSGNGVVGP